MADIDYSTYCQNCHEDGMTGVPTGEKRDVGNGWYEQSVAYFCPNCDKIEGDYLYKKIRIYPN